MGAPEPWLTSAPHFFRSRGPDDIRTGRPRSFRALAQALAPVQVEGGGVLPVFGPPFRNAHNRCSCNSAGATLRCCFLVQAGSSALGMAATNRLDRQRSV